MKMKNESGQIALIGLLVMVTTLAIALSVVGRSTTEIATSTNTEESSRALSAAEGALEKALLQTQGNPQSITDLPVTFSNQAIGNVNVYPLPSAGLALGHPKITKSSYAQFWLAHPVNTVAAGVPAPFYQEPSFDLYFGTAENDLEITNRYNDYPEDKPAVEVRIVFYDSSTGQYSSRIELLDSNSARVAAISNGFIALNNSQCKNSDGWTRQVNQGVFRNYYCSITISYPVSVGTLWPIMARVRILYSSLAHPVAVEPTTGSLPPQANIYISSGQIGNVQRKIEVFQQQNVLPYFFDFVLFSGGTLTKP